MQQEFDNEYCKQLNTQQKEAVHAVDGPVLLLAVPGSGKTTVLVTRLGYMVCCRKIAPGSILTMTYTVAATAEMKQRFAALFGEEYARNMAFHTINSLASQIIAFYARHRGSGQTFALVENREAVQILARLYQQIHQDYATESIIQDIRTGITYVKNRMLGAAEMEKLDLGIDGFDKIYHGYCQALKQNGLMDFDDQLSYALTILKKYPDIREHFQDRFPYICVDEAQDTSRIQHEILKLLAQKHGNLFLVGDEDQSIYGFRAAYPEALLNFEKDYPGARVLLMENNYRSVKEIVTAADAFISQNRSRHPKTLKASRESGRQVQIIQTHSRDNQYAYLFEVARQCTAETAILYRNNDSALPLIDLFERRGVPYNCRRFEDSFFTHRLVADILDIIRFAYDPHNTELFLRVYYKFGSPISRKAAQYACDQSARTGKSILEELVYSPELKTTGREASLDLRTVLSQLPEASAEEAIVRIWKTLKYGSYAAANGLDPGKYEILCLLARREKTPEDFLRRLETLHERICGHENRPENQLLLSTIHASKGLEYERVYLLDVFDGILPSKKKSECREEEDFRSYEEDRRIFYVGMTRAKDELYCFRCGNRACAFVSEVEARLPEELVEEEDLFAPLKGPLLGKSYMDREKGKGRVMAQCGDLLLVNYPNREPELKSLAQLMADRDRTPQYGNGKKQMPAQSMNLSVEPGRKLRHKSFGPGEVLRVQKGVAEIRFPEPYGVKRIMLRTSIQTGILSL